MSNKHIKKLEGPIKVINRGGAMGVLTPLCLVYDCAALYKEFDNIINPPPGQDPKVKCSIECLTTREPYDVGWHQHGRLGSDT
jgi:hypothetical protein